MNIQPILLPVFVEVGLVFVLRGLLARSRMAAFPLGRDRRTIASNAEAFAPQARPDAHAHQCAMPVLFPAAAMLAIVVRQASTAVVMIGSRFVAARPRQAVVHGTINNVWSGGLLLFAGAIFTPVLSALIASCMLLGSL